LKFIMLIHSKRDNALSNGYSILNYSLALISKLTSWLPGQGRF
jgi:hypothetical protein